MIIDTSNALAAPGSSRGYACLSVACRSIAPRGCLRAPRGARLGVPSQGPPGPSVPLSADPATSALLFPPRPPLPPPPRGPCVVTRRVEGGRGAPGRERERERGRAAPPPAKTERGRESRLGPSSRGRHLRSGFLPRGLPRAARGSRGSGFVGPGRVEGPVPVAAVVVGGGGACCVWWRGWEEGGSGGKGVWRGERGWGSASRSPRFAARPWWRPGVRPTAAPAPLLLLLPAAPPPRPRPPRPPARTHARPPGSPRGASSGAGSPPRGPPGRARGRGPGVRVSPAATRGTPRCRPPSRARPRLAAAPRRAGAPSRAAASGRGGSAAASSDPSPRPPRGTGRGVCGARPAPGPCPSLRSSRSGGAARGCRRPRLSLSRRLSPRRARLSTGRRAGGRSGRRDAVRPRPPSGPSPPAGPVPPSETRPQIRRGDPLNLSILVSGGKETNQDSLSNGE